MLNTRRCHADARRPRIPFEGQHGSRKALSKIRANRLGSYPGAKASRGSSPPGDLKAFSHHETGEVSTRNQGCYWWERVRVKVCPGYVRYPAPSPGERLGEDPEHQLAQRLGGLYGRPDCQGGCLAQGVLCSVSRSRAPSYPPLHRKTPRRAVAVSASDYLTEGYPLSRTLWR